MLPGRKKIGEFTLTRGVTNDKSWQNWISQVFEGNMMGARKGGQINIYDYMGIPVKSFKFVNGWAKSIEYGQMKAGEATILTEKLTIAHEGIEPA
jgi:phage tail-like protein